MTHRLRVARAGCACVLAGLILALPYILVRRCESSKPGRSLDRALFDAVARDDVRGARGLLQRGANVNVRYEDVMGPFSPPIESLPGAWRSSLYVPTPLVAAVWSRDDAMVRLLLDAGARINYRSPKLGYTALGCAISDGNGSTVRLLLARGADVTGPAYNGMTPLQVARWRGRTDVEDLLRRAGARR